MFSAQNPAPGATGSLADPAEARLGRLRPGCGGTVARLDLNGVTLGALSASELELRLIEMGFIEGAEVLVQHEGLFGGDPLAVKLGAMRVALRRREADAVIVRQAALEARS